MKTSVLTFGLLTILPLAASAMDRLSYNYVEGNYVRTNSDHNTDVDGFGIKGSYAFSPNFHVFGDLNRQDFPHNDGYSFNEWRAGVGYNAALNDSADFLGRVAYAETDVNGPYRNSHGYNLEAGIRNSFNQNFEGYVLAGYEDYTHNNRVLSNNGDFYARVGGQVKFNQNWGIVADLKLGGNGYDQWTIGPRLTW